MFLNVAFVGEQGVGKASLKQMLVMHNQTKDSENNEQAPGMGSVSSIKIAGRRVKIDCVNTSDCLARPESFWRKQLHGLVLLYDMSSPTTFDAISSLVRQVRAAGFLSASAKQAVPVVLLANKADRGGFVCSEVNEFCLEQNVKLVEVCCSQPDLKSTLQSARSAASASSQLREAAIVAIHQMIQEISASSRGGQSSPSGAPPSANSLSSGGATPTASRRSRRQRRSSSFGMASQSGSTTDEIQDTSSSSTASSSGAFDPNGAANALISAFQTECTVASSGSASAGPVPRLSFGHGSQVPILATGGVSGCSSSSSGGTNVPVSPSPSPKRRRRSLLDVGSNAFSAIIPHKKKKRRRDSLLQDATDSESDASDSDSEMATADFDAQPQSGSSSLTPRGLFSSLSSGNKGEAGHQMGPFASQILNLDGAFALEDVLEVLLFGRQDSRQVQKLSEDFLMSFRSSITVNQLIDALIGRWRGPSITVAADPTAAGRLLKSRRSIVDLLIKWMEVMDEEDPILCSADAETVMAKEKLSVFIESEIASIAQNSEAFDRLQLLWTRKFSQVILGGASNVPASAAPQKPLATARLMELEPTTVAQQLTIMFSRMFSKIKTAELVDCAWANAEKAPNLSAIIRESNRIQQWVWSQVLQQAESIRERVQVIQWFIQVASRCLQPLKNFESMYAIVRGLTSLPVDRLKRTWSMVDDSLKKKLDSMNQMMLQPEGSTKSYRNELKRSNPPCVPYPGYWLSKLVRIKEQNGLLVPTLGANCSAESTLIVNLASFEANCKVIRWWKRYQQSQYSLSFDKDILSLLRSITPTVTDDDQAYELSVQHEPVGQNVPVSSSEAGSTQSSSSSQESGSSLKKLRRLSSSSGSLNVNEKVDEKIKTLDQKANELMQIYMTLKATLTVDDTAPSPMAMQDVSCPSPLPIRRSGSGSVVLSEANLLTDEARRNYEDMMKQARKLLKKWATRCENTSKFLDYYSPDGERQSLRFADILSRSSAVETLCLVLSGRAIEPKTRLCIRKIFGQCLVGSESEQELLIQLIETQLQDVNADSIQLVNELIKCFKIPDSYLANRNKITIVTRQIDQERQHCDEVLARLEQLTAFFDPSANIPTSARAQQEDKLLTEVLESKRRVSVLVQQRQQLCQWKDNTKHVMFENYGKFLQTYESRLQKQRQDRRNTLIQRLNEAVTTQTNQKRLIDERYQSKQTDHSRQQKKIEARQRELLAEQQELERLLAENREKQRQAEAEAAKLQQRVARRKNEYRTKIDELQSHVKSLESEVTETERDQQLQNQKKQMMSRFFSYFQQVSQSARDANENHENHQRVVKDFYSTLSTQLSKRHQMMRDLREESRVMYDSVKSVERMQLRPEIILKEFPELIQKCKDLLNRSDRFRADYISFAKTCVPEASEISTLVQVVPAAHSCLKLSEELAEMIRQVADARQYLFKFASL